MGSVQFCEDLRLAGEGPLSHSDPFLCVSLVSNQAGPADCYHKCSSIVHQSLLTSSPVTVRNEVLQVRIPLLTKGAVWALYPFLFLVCLLEITVVFSPLVARLSMKHLRILQLDEDVLCVRYSPNQKLLAVSLLDCTVKVFYVDTLKVCNQMGCETVQEGM